MDKRHSWNVGYWLLAVVALVAAAATGGHFWLARNKAQARSLNNTSIAVLPFADLSPGKDHEYFSDGLAEEIPTIRAIKDWSGDPMQHERNIRGLQSLPRPVTVLTTHSAWLMSSLVLGCNGLLSGAGSVIADLQVALFEAVRADDLARARAINDRIYPLAQAFYAPPFLDMHNRMKEVLALLGRLPPAVVRPPLLKLPPHEIERLKQAIAAAGLGRAPQPALAAE